MLTGYYPQCVGEASSISPRNRHQSGHNGGSGFKGPPASGVLISASSSRMFTSYEISDEISRAKVQCLERKYGGRIRAHAAATRIQRTFRRFRLEQQFRQVLQHPGQPGRRRGQFPTPASDAMGDRQLYMRKLALSQPTLRYQQPITTSLRAQLRAEQCTPDSAPNQPQQHPNQHRPQLQGGFESGTLSPNGATPQFQSPLHSRSPPSPRPVEPLPLQAQQRPFIELMSPRLAQRRVITVSSPLPNQSLPPSQMLSPRHFVGGSPARRSIGLTPPMKHSDHQQPLVVATGTTPSVWVPRQGSDSTDFTDAPPRMPVSLAQNGHTVAYFTNSLPRMDRRNHSVGPHHKTSNICSELPTPNHSLNPQAVQQMLSDQQRRRWYRIALNFFNKKPDRGLHLLINWGFVDDTPQAVAKLFLGRRGLSKQMIGEFLGTLHSPFHANVLDCFINEIDMYKMEVDVALRHMLTFFRLPGEAQKIDHIMQAFGKRYMTCNPDSLSGDLNTDMIYVIAFAVIMLNTDLHTPSLKDSRRMKPEDFIHNLRGIENGKLLPEDWLLGIYERIKTREFKPGTDHVTQVIKVDQSIVGKDKPKLVEPHRRLICYCRLHQVTDVNRKQAITAHQREIFLFNDLMLVAKILTKKKPVAQYTLRYWTPLVGLKVSTFQTQLYPFGVHIQCPDGETLIFNAKNNDDRCRFLADVRESVMESTEMESIRIELELDKQDPMSQRSLIGSRLARADAQRDSGLPDLDTPPVNNIGASFALDAGARSGSIADSPGGPSSSAAGVSRLHQNGTSSGVSSVSAGSTSSSGTPAPTNRRLSFNSLDSGMVEETVDLSV
uniref:SEC7 domain-containing protein n=1 Tax=Panagrellus redivivus TaxID=6233 RepID=A0A7E4W049_PANRE